MDNKDVFNAVQNIIKDVFDAKDTTITRDTQASDVDGWDSLSHAILMLRIESAFKVKFALEDAYKFSDVGELVDHVQKLIKGSG